MSEQGNETEEECSGDKNGKMDMCSDYRKDCIRKEYARESVGVT